MASYPDTDLASVRANDQQISVTGSPTKNLATSDNSSSDHEKSAGALSRDTSSIELHISVEGSVAICNIGMNFNSILSRMVGDTSDDEYDNDNDTNGGLAEQLTQEGIATECDMLTTVAEDDSCVEGLVEDGACTKGDSFGPKQEILLSQYLATCVTNTNLSGESVEEGSTKTDDDNDSADETDTVCKEGKLCQGNSVVQLAMKSLTDSEEAVSKDSSYIGAIFNSMLSYMVGDTCGYEYNTDNVNDGLAKQLALEDIATECDMLSTVAVDDLCIESLVDDDICRKGDSLGPKQEMLSSQYLDTCVMDKRLSGNLVDKSSTITDNDNDSADIICEEEELYAQGNGWFSLHRNL